MPAISSPAESDKSLIASPVRILEPPPPPPPLPPPVPVTKITEADVKKASNAPSYHPTRQWLDDYQFAHEHARGWSEKQWDTKSGWAAGRDSWYEMGGWTLVQQMTTAKQKQDAEYATFQANFKYTQRVQHAQNKAQVQYLARAWQEAQNRHDEKVAMLDGEKKRLEEINAKIAQVAHQTSLVIDRAAARMMQLDEFEAATEAQRATLSAQLCERLRNRPDAGPGVSISVDECCLCLDAACTHISSACMHVIGCESCCIKHRNRHGNICPICNAQTTFEEMHFP